MGPTTPNEASAMTETEQKAPGQLRRFRITRRRHGAARSRVDEFDVAVGPETTLLDALREIRSHQDRSLTLRYSCCHASCGTCGMRANGREVLACVTPLASLGSGPIAVEPLANARVEHDLVVDMRDLYESLEPTGRPLIRQDEQLAGRRSPAPPSPGTRTASNAGCACRRARSPDRIRSTWARRRWPRPGARWPSPGAPTRCGCSPGRTTSRAAGAVTPASNAPRSARPESIRPARCWRCGGS